MGKFTKLIDDNYKQCIEFGEGYDSKTEYAGCIIFDFTTYSGEMDVLFANKMIEVLKCILNRTTFDYIKDEKQYINYLTMINMPFLIDKIEWGTSIRGAWFDIYKEYEIDNIKIEEKDLEIYINDLIEWCD